MSMHTLRRTVLLLVATAAVAVLPARAEAKLKVAATIETLADLARQVGGVHVEVTSLSHGYMDPHLIQAKLVASRAIGLNRADAVLYVGLELRGRVAYAAPSCSSRATRASSKGSPATSTPRPPSTSRTCRAYRPIR